MPWKSLYWEEGIWFMLIEYVVDNNNNSYFLRICYVPDIVQTAPPKAANHPWDNYSNVIILPCADRKVAYKG